MPPRLRPGQTLLLASLVFGLFFGAGNLIFPAGLGRDAGTAVTPATLGFLVTAVGLPVLGIVASAVTGARSVREMTAPVSRRFAVAFTCLLYLTIGPLFAIPRTATVSYEIGVAPLAGDGGLRLLGFTAAFFAVAAVAAFRPGRLMEWVGRYLTPAFLVLLGALVAAAVVAPMSTGEHHIRDSHSFDAARLIPPAHRVGKQVVPLLGQSSRHSELVAEVMSRRRVGDSRLPRQGAETEVVRAILDNGIGGRCQNRRLEVAVVISAGHTPKSTSGKT